MVECFVSALYRLPLDRLSRQSRCSDISDIWKWLAQLPCLVLDRQLWALKRDRSARRRCALIYKGAKEIDLLRRPTSPRDASHNRHRSIRHLCQRFVSHDCRVRRKTIPPAPRRSVRCPTENCSLETVRRACMPFHRTGEVPDQLSHRRRFACREYRVSSSVTS